MMREDFYRLPLWAGKMANLYWRLRHGRTYDTAHRRRFYRYIAAERQRLEKEGRPKEYIRLIGRYLANPDNRIAEERCRAFDETGKILTWIQARAKQASRAHSEKSDFTWL